MKNVLDAHKKMQRMQENIDERGNLFPKGNPLNQTINLRELWKKYDVKICLGILILIAIFISLGGN